MKSGVKEIELTNYKWWRPKRFLSEITPDNSWGIEIFLHIQAGTLLRVEKLLTTCEDAPSYSSFTAAEFTKAEFLKHLQKKIEYQWKESYNYEQSEEYQHFKQLMDNPDSFCIR